MGFVRGRLYNVVNIFFFKFELTFYSNYWRCYVRSMKSTFSCWKMKSELVEQQSIEQSSSHPILLVNNSLALTEHRLSDPSALDGADWSAMRMLTDLLIINCSLSSCEGKGNIYLRSLFKKKDIHRKRNKNTSKSSDLKKTTFRAFDSRHLHIRKNVLDDANW